jgi:hypothetical protein
MTDSQTQPPGDAPEHADTALPAQENEDFPGGGGAPGPRQADQAEGEREDVPADVRPGASDETGTAHG